jgi:hypothetical protein
MTQRYFIWDNLLSHLSSIFHLMVEGWQHGLFQIIRRPAYQPEDGPIEFVIHQLVEKLMRRVHRICSNQDLMTHINNTAANLNGIDNTFTHCGYVW